MGKADLVRCPWTGIADAEYTRYHDEEWGVPKTDDRALLEKLVLEGFQSGLSWLTILKKRDNFRAAFAGFDPEKVAGFGARDVNRLLGDAGIVRHRGKIEATIANARAVCGLHDRGESLADIVWSHARSGRIRAPRTVADISPTTPESVALSKRLRSLGFRFVGPTTVYAAMQATGVVNDHLVGCHARAACEQLRRAGS
jgi:DNA-3-methyladenine glycosylase I